MNSQYLIIDNGAGRIKYGKYSPNGNIFNSMPNCTARIAKQMQVLVGDDIDKIYNGSLLQYLRPFERGYLNNWPAEIEIWTKLLADPNLNIQNISEHSIVMTEAPFNPIPWQNDTNEIIYEYFGFKSQLRLPAAWFSNYEFQHTHPEIEYPENATIIDSGFSFTHVLPFLDGKCIKHAVRLKINSIII